MIHLTHDLDTPVHRELATVDWLRSCAQALEARIRLTLAFQTEDGEGCVSNDYSEEWMERPNGVVKY
jgi:hypothetical protein